MSKTTVKNTKKVDEAIKRLNDLMMRQTKGIPVHHAARTGLRKRILNMSLDERSEVWRFWKEQQRQPTTEEQAYIQSFPAIQKLLKGEE